MPLLNPGATLVAPSPSSSHPSHPLPTPSPYGVPPSVLVLPTAPSLISADPQPVTTPRVGTVMGEESGSPTPPAYTPYYPHGRANSVPRYGGPLDTSVPHAAATAADDDAATVDATTTALPAPAKNATAWGSGGAHPQVHAEAQVGWQLAAASNPGTVLDGDGGPTADGLFGAEAQQPAQHATGQAPAPECGGAPPLTDSDPPPPSSPGSDMELDGGTQPQKPDTQPVVAQDSNPQPHLAAILAHLARVLPQALAPPQPMEPRGMGQQPPLPRFEEAWGHPPPPEDPPPPMPLIPDALWPQPPLPPQPPHLTQPEMLQQSGHWASTLQHSPEPWTQPGQWPQPPLAMQPEQWQQPGPNTLPPAGQVWVHPHLHHPTHQHPFHQGPQHQQPYQQHHYQQPGEQHHLYHSHHHLPYGQQELGQGQEVHWQGQAQAQDGEGVFREHEQNVMLQGQMPVNEAQQGHNSHVHHCMGSAGQVGTDPAAPPQQEEGVGQGVLGVGSEGNGDSGLGFEGSEGGEDSCEVPGCSDADEAAALGYFLPGM